MTSPASHLQNSRMDHLIMAAEMQSNAHLSLAPFYLCPSPPIPTPKNKSELELYKLLERANLIDYFPTFIKYGGDDVLQLAEANEEEFIEIVQLIGMNEKPLHVRRLQKALSQWSRDRTEAMAIESERRLAYLYDSGYRQANTTTESNTNTPNAATAAASPHTDNQTSLDADSNQQQPQYFAPHEIIRNVPKRLRLMDSIKPSDLTKGIQMYDSSAYSTPVRPPWLKSRGLKLTTASDSQQTTPIQISPPESVKVEDSDEDSDDNNQNTGPARNRRKRSNVNLSKSK